MHFHSVHVIICPLKNLSESSKIMYLNQNSLQYKHYQDFVKYAQFVGEKFDLQIELDATRAETDGKTIYLPNVLTMTEKELDMMYAILLHEVGHIRYSTFSEDYFKSLKTQAHAYLANSIEDARIENLLMKDFGGAAEMFESLYCEYTQDKALMKKVFKHEGERPDMFACLAFHAHNSIVNCTTPSMKEISGAYRANRLMKFWRTKNIDQVIAGSPLKNDKDVLALTNTLYDLFVDYFHAKDKSAKLDYAKEIAEKKAMENLLDKLRKEAEAVQEQVEQIRQKVTENEQKIDEYDNQHRDEMNQLRQQVQSVQENIQNASEKIIWKNEYDQNKKTVDELPAKIDAAQKDLEKQVAEKARLEKQLQDGKNGRGKDLTDEQKEAIKAKIETKKRQEERLTQKTKNLQDNLTSTQDALQQAEKQAAQNPADFDKNLDVFATQEYVQEQAQSMAEMNKKMADIESGKAEMVQENNNLISQMDNMQSAFMEKASEAMFALDKQGRAADMDMGIMPDLNYEDSWPEAAAAQQQFDQSASNATGKMVRNGQKAAGLFGSNIRDIVSFIDKTKEKVEEINVAEIFKNKIHASKLEELHSDVKEMNYMEDKSVVGVFGTRRDHIPLTTEFDSVKKENVSNKMQDKNALMVEHGAFYRDLKRLFARKLKFAKKDFWRGGQEEGQLDARNLWKLPTRQGDDFYEVSNPKFVNKLAATILVDVSGSQNKDATEYGKKIRALVLGLSQALDEVHVKHEVLGFHAPVCEEMRHMQSSQIYTRRSNRLETIVYKDAAQKDNLGIMNIETQMSDNSDGESLRIALKRLKAIRAKSHMVFIISDGKPFLCDTDVSVLDEDFRAALRQAVREKVQVFGIGFFEQLKHFVGERFCDAKDFNNVLKFFDKQAF